MGFCLACGEGAVCAECAKLTEEQQRDKFQWQLRLYGQGLVVFRESERRGWVLRLKNMMVGPLSDGCVGGVLDAEAEFGPASPEECIAFARGASRHWLDDLWRP